MKKLMPLVFALAASPALSQDVKVLLCTADTQLNLNSETLQPTPSNETYAWELNYNDDELISVAAPFACNDGTEDWEIGNTVLSMECQRGVQGGPQTKIFAEIDRYTKKFVVSGIGLKTGEVAEEQALWVHEGRCELARRKF